MAKAEAKPAADAEQPAPPPKSKKLLILGLAAMLVIALVGGGTFVYYKAMKANQADDEDATETAKKDDKKEKLPSIFVNLDPFTVNLAQDPNQKSPDQYLQVAISVEFEDPQAEAMMKASMPKIRNSITLLLSGKMASELLPREGKEKLASELKKSINEVLEPGGPPKKAKKGDKTKSEPPAKAVLFTSFIIQ